MSDVEMGSPAANDAVRAMLASHGDDGSAPRHVLHYAYPKGSTGLESRPEMISELRGRGLEVKDAAEDDGLVMEHERSVSADDFDTVTQELQDYFDAHDWDYDGWECAVVMT